VSCHGRTSSAQPRRMRASPIPNGKYLVDSLQIQCHRYSKAAGQNERTGTAPTRESCTGGTTVLGPGVLPGVLLPWSSAAASRDLFPFQRLAAHKNFSASSVKSPSIRQCTKRPRPRENSQQGPSQVVHDRKGKSHLLQRLGSTQVASQSGG